MIDTVADILFWVLFSIFVAYWSCYSLNQHNAGDRFPRLGRFLCALGLHSDEWETNVGDGKPWEPPPSTLRITLKCGRCGIDRQTWSERA